MQKLSTLLFVLLMLVVGEKLSGQTLQASTNFQQPDIPVTLSPEHPGFCNAGASKARVSDGGTGISCHKVNQEKKNSDNAPLMKGSQNLNKILYKSIK